MAQGSGKLGGGGKKKSAGSQRRKTVKIKKKKGKGSSKVESKDKGIVAATKQINRKNERIIAAKAASAHTKFYLKDLSEKGKKNITINKKKYTQHVREDRTIYIYREIGRHRCYYDQ